MSRAIRAAGAHIFSNGSPDKIIQWISLNHNEYLSGVRVFSNTINRLPECVKQHKALHNLISRALLNLLESTMPNLRTNYCGNSVKHNSECALLIEKCNPYLNCNSKESIVDIILQYNTDFQPYGRKIMSEIAARYVPHGDHRAFKVLKTFYKVLEKESFSVLMSKIDGGFENKQVQKILSNTNRYALYYFSEHEVNADDSLRVKLLKELVKTPSLIGKLDFEFSPTIEEIKEIAPAMRFNFLQFAFRTELRITESRWCVPDRLQMHRAESKLKMPYISEKEMKDILFSVCIHKNDEVNYWLASYKKYSNKKYTERIAAKK